MHDTRIYPTQRRLNKILATKFANQFQVWFNILQCCPRGKSLSLDHKVLDKKAGYCQQVCEGNLDTRSV